MYPPLGKKETNYKEEKYDKNYWNCSQNFLGWLSQNSASRHFPKFNIPCAKGIASKVVASPSKALVELELGCTWTLK